MSCQTKRIHEAKLQYAPVRLDMYLLLTSCLIRPIPTFIHAFMYKFVDGCRRLQAGTVDDLQKND